MATARLPIEKFAVVLGRKAKGDSGSDIGWILHTATVTESADRPDWRCDCNGLVCRSADQNFPVTLSDMFRRNRATPLRNAQQDVDGVIAIRPNRKVVAHGPPKAIMVS